MEEKSFKKLEMKNNRCINVFGYEGLLVFPVDVSDQTFAECMDLLLLIHNDSQWRNLIRSSLFKISAKNSNK